MNTVLLLIGFLLASIHFAEAQQAKRIFRIGYLTVSSLSAEASRIEAFRRGLRELGYLEGQNIVIEQRSAADMYERLPELADDLMRIKVDFILSGGASATRVAQKVTSTIPIIMASTTDDPVTAGFVASLARPGRNITGLTSISTELSGKRLQLLKEVLPNASRAAVLLNPDNPRHASRLKEIEAAARGIGITLQSLAVRSSQDFESAFRATVKERADALNVMGDALFNSHRQRIADLAAKNRLPAMYDRDDFVDAGGLMSYGVDVDDLYRRASYYVDKILKGAKPADLPVEQPTKFELVINLKAAKQIGLTIPPTVLARADKVIR
jgi:putative tryptophan/tyrosine transport system substrate-binding protein